MSFRGRFRETIENMSDEEDRCEVNANGGQTVVDVSDGKSNIDSSSEVTELPLRKNSRGLFGSLKKKFVSSFHKKRHTFHHDSSCSLNTISDSSCAESEINHGRTRKRDKAFKFMSRLKTKSASDISFGDFKHSNSKRRSDLHQVVENSLDDSGDAIKNSQSHQNGPPCPRNCSIPARANRDSGPKDVTNCTRMAVSSERRVNDSCYGFYTKIPPVYDHVKTLSDEVWCLTTELLKLSKFGWYWGPISRMEAEEKLANQEDGTFLVRDSSDERYLLSLSFRSSGKTLHTRVEHCNGVFSFYAQPESEGYSSIVDLIENSMIDSKRGIFCYSRSRYPGSPAFPVRLSKPMSRFAQVRSLQYLCRFVIRQATRLDHIQSLPLPTSIKGWLTENHY